MFCALFGISMSSIAFRLDRKSQGDTSMMLNIANAFFAASATFLGAALYGYVTNRDLTKHGRHFVHGAVWPDHGDDCQLVLGPRLAQHGDFCGGRADLHRADRL